MHLNDDSELLKSLLFLQKHVSWLPYCSMVLVFIFIFCFASGPGTPVSPDRA